MDDPRPGPFWAPLIGFLILLLIIGGGGWFGYTWLRDRLATPTIRIMASEQCIADAGGESSSLDLEQARHAGIIAAEGMRRGLPARAVTIALATAVQESSLRNIDHGDRDSVGLFQQRPSQGWGTVDQIMDPWYSSGKFYEALVKVPDWQTGDVNDVAQLVQRSGHPEAYRKHEPMARTFASVLTGHSPAGLRCVNHSASTVVPTLDKVLKNGLGTKATVSRTSAGVVITSSDPTTLWAGVALAMTQFEQARFSSVEVAGQVWTHDDYSVARWAATTPDPSPSVTPSGPQPGPTVAMLTFG